MPEQSHKGNNQSTGGISQAEAQEIWAEWKRKRREGVTRYYARISQVVIKRMKRQSIYSLTDLAVILVQNGLPHKTVGYVAAAMVRTGEVERVGHGKYRLVQED